MTVSNESHTIGLIGAGNISRRYITGMSRFPELNIVGCVDAIPEAAAALARDASIRAYPTISDMLADPAIEVVVNITPPTVHAEVAIAALEAGKHVYGEKPIAANLKDAAEMLEVARRTGRVLATAPDTFLGSAAQTARHAIDSGAIGEPIAAVAFITHTRIETWHPNPTFFFQPGGGPLLDMGPYYITSLINLFGPVATVSGSTRIGSPVRTVTTPARTVDSVTVTTPTHASATLVFASGAIATLIASFDIWESHLPKIEVYGSEGTLTVPDPNEFDGPVSVRRIDDSDWKTLPPVIPVTGEPAGPEQYLRGIGVADLVGYLNGQPLRVSSELGYHVLEVLEAIQVASDTGERVTIASAPPRPEPRILLETSTSEGAE